MVAPLVLAAINAAPAVWNGLSKENKDKIKALVLAGNIGMAKIVFNRAKVAAKKKKAEKQKKKAKKARGKKR